MSESDVKPEVEPSMNAEEDAERGATEAQERREQLVILFRHGIAEDGSGEKPDADRALTRKGQKRMKRISRGLEGIQPKVDAIFSSPLLRAIQTAMWLRKRYGNKHDVEILDGLVPGSDPQAVIDVLRECPRRVVLVGHEPHLTALMKAMVGMPAETPVKLDKGGCYGIRITPEGERTLEWVLPEKVLRRLG